LAAACGLAGVVLYVVCARMGSLQFHYFAEAASAALAAALFLAAWKVGGGKGEGFFRVIGPAFGAVAVLGALHAVTSDGLGVTADRSMDVPVQLGTAALCVLSVSFVVAAWAARRALRPVGPLTAYAVLTVGLVVVIFETDLFPHCVNAARGPTLFKLFSEGSASVALGAAALWLVRRRDAFDGEVLWLLLGGLFVTTLSEYLLVCQEGPGDLPVRLGHLARVLAFCLLYQAVAQAAAREPGAAFVRELEEQNRDLRQEVTQHAEAEAAARKHAALLNAANRILRGALACSTSHDVAQVYLEVAMELTGSEMGFIGFVDETARLKVVRLVDRGAPASCRAEGCGGGLPTLDFDGLLRMPLIGGRSTIFGEPVPRSFGAGLPGWGGRVKCFVGVPFRRAGLVTGMVGLANKPGGYQARDSAAIEDLSVAFMEACSRKEVEDEREELASLNEAILDTIPENVLILDAELKVLGTNRRDIEGYDLYAALAAGKHPHFTDVLGPALVERAGLEARLHIALASQAPDEILAVAHPADDHSENRHDERFLDLRIRPFEVALRGGEAQPRLLLSILDATRRRALEEQARQRSKLESIGTLAGGVAHDFNNILTGVIGYTAILLDEGLDGADSREYLEQVNQLAQRAAGLTRQLLVFSRKQTMTPMAVNVNTCIEGLAKMLRRIIGEDVELELGLSPTLEYVQADPTHIEQIVMNLAVNARDAMADGGTLTIETGNVLLDGQDRRRHVGVTPGPHVVIVVSDTGCGMDEATRERIFEPFYTTKGVGKGTGLGLATVYGIVEQHSGRIWVESEPGKGTTIEVYLPVAQEEVPEPLSPQSDLEGDGSAKVLAVDDEASVLDVVRQALESRGHRVVCCGDAVQAEALFEELGDEIGLLLTDVVMPGILGPALYERLAARRPSLQVLYMSGYTERAAVGGSAVPSGAAFVQKPFTPDALARKVREVLGSPAEAVAS
jgi:two-component system cell cycle sensor histidine kinase/response regulator CckA